MYYRHFGLDGPPFRFAPSAAVLYLGTAHRECLAALEWALLHDECGFMLLIGETGTGKTTLLNAILARKVANLQLACVTNPRLSFQEIMRVLLPQLGVQTDPRGKLELIQELERVAANRPAGHRVAIAIDEAQDLSDGTFEDFRLLANRIDLQIVLMGHPELLDRLSAHHLRQLRERISTKVSLQPLSANESVAYVECRLAAQGGSTRIFEPKALRYIVSTAAGIPRRLNVLCHNALLLACSKIESTVTLAVAREVVADYQSIVGPAPAKPVRTRLAEVSLRSLLPSRPVRPVSTPAAPLSGPAVAASKPAPSVSRAEAGPKPEPVSRQPIVLSDAQRVPASGDQEPELRPHRKPIYAAAACAAVVVATIGVLSVPTTQNWANEINRAVPAIAGLIRPVEAGASPASSAADKTAAPKPDDTAPALGYTAPSAAAGGAPSTQPPRIYDVPNSTVVPAAAPRHATIQIHAGDTFHDLATKYLGSKDRTVDLIKANPQIADPDVLYVGQIVYLPSTRNTNQTRVVQ